MKFKVIDMTISVGSQNVNYLEYLKNEDTSIRIDILSNAHKFQCHARLSALDSATLQWNEVARIQPLNMQTQEGLCYQPVYRAGSTSLRDFAADREKLLKLFQELVE